MHRREMLAIAGGSLSVAMAGCLGDDDDDDNGDEEPVNGDDDDDNGEPEDEPAEFEVDNLAPAEATAVVGETLSVSADVSNVGDLSGTTTVELRLDGEAVASSDVDLDGGASETVSFDADTTELAAGEYTHSVWTEDDEAAGSLTLQVPAAFEVSDLDPASATAGIGQTVTVSATVTNTGGVAGEKTVEARLDGEAVASEDLELDSEADAVVSFDVPTSDLAEGEYTHSVWTEDDEVSGTLTLEIPEEPASIGFDEQTINGESATIASARLDDGGFVVIHGAGWAEEPIESVLGVSEYLEPGFHEDLTVPFEGVLMEDATLTAMAHRDTNENEAFDYVETEGEEDGAYVFEEEPVATEAAVTVELPPTVEEAVAEANQIIETLNTDPDGSLSTINEQMENVDDIELIGLVDAATEDEASAEADRLREEWDRVEADIFRQVPLEINEQSQEQMGFDLIDDPESIQTAPDAREEADEVEGLSPEAADALNGAADVADAAEEGLHGAADILDSARIFEDEDEEANGEEEDANGEEDEGDE